MRQLLRQRIADGLLDHERAAPLALPPPYDEADIGDAVQEFRVRNDLDDETESATVRAKLWAVGTASPSGSMSSCPSTSTTTATTWRRAS